MDKLKKAIAPESALSGLKGKARARYLSELSEREQKLHKTLKKETSKFPPKNLHVEEYKPNFIQRLVNGVVKPEPKLDKPVYQRMRDLLTPARRAKVPKSFEHVHVSEPSHGPLAAAAIGIAGAFALNKAFRKNTDKD